ncbi:reverse transcriptase [Cucumis melo var. makuwa]|uniref:Reverse transcriptase n=1 Tax=Cucumis melo var. makuwa TaxID=1194695 RepID=A0A5D3BAH4_CUCMM|nr:reverse transcriptase [Cucumis melo var. makuwa]TYJ96850.1 reverse transcriptase [Cucumis melo var. makuwa]
MSIILTLIRPNLPLGLRLVCLLGILFTSAGESVSEESNNTFEFIEPTPSTVSDVDPYPIILPTNQVPWKTYYRMNLRKEVRSPTSQPSAPVQDFEPPRDQGMKNLTEPCTNNTMSENDRSDVAVLENMEEKNRGDEIEVRIETSNNEAEHGHTRKLDEYDLSLDILIVLRKGCKWVFSLKYKADGTLDRHKASQGHSDHTLFTKVSKTGKIVILIIYVDDIVLTGDDQTEISQLKQRMGDEFEIKDLGNLKYFLGMEAARSKEGISVSQRKYTLDLLTETGMLGCCPADTPIEFNSY